MDAMQEKLADQLEQIILNRISQDKLIVPAMPAVATRCLALLRDPDFALKRAVSIIENDPMIAARIMRIANSAAMASGGSVLTLESAVARIGVQKLKTALIEASSRQLFESRDPAINRACRGLWEHSVAVAVVARDLVLLTGNAELTDSAYLCGLLHDVGKPIVAALLLEAEKSISGGRRGGWVADDGWIGIIGRTHRRVGIELATQWALSDEIVSGIRDCNDFDPAKRDSVANYVRFANAVAKREGIYVGPVDKDDANAMIMVGRSLLNIGDDILGRLTAGLKDRAKLVTD